MHGGRTGPPAQGAEQRLRGPSGCPDALPAPGRRTPRTPLSVLAQKTPDDPLDGGRGPRIVGTSVPGGSVCPREPVGSPTSPPLPHTAPFHDASRGLSKASHGLPRPCCTDYGCTCHVGSLCEAKPGFEAGPRLAGTCRLHTRNRGLRPVPRLVGDAGTIVGPLQASRKRGRRPSARPWRGRRQRQAQTVWALCAKRRVQRDPLDGELLFSQHFIPHNHYLMKFYWKSMAALMNLLCSLRKQAGRVFSLALESVYFNIGFAPTFTPGLTLESRANKGMPAGKETMRRNPGGGGRKPERACPPPAPPRPPRCLRLVPLWGRGLRGWAGPGGRTHALLPTPSASTPPGFFPPAGNVKTHRVGAPGWLSRLTA